MAAYDIVKSLNQYFLDNWSDTSIQFEGMVLDTSALDSWISLTYSPVNNECVGVNGSTTGRIEYNGLWKVFCYAKNPTKTYQLADSVKTFFNGKQIGNIRIEVGQDGVANKLNDGWYESLCYFQISEL